MKQIIDFSSYPLSSRNLEYGGRAGEKKGIIFNNDFWFLKFPKNTQNMKNVKGLSYATSPLSEYIGSNIFKILGYETHETILGICFDGKRYKVVCACKDFIKDDKNEMLIPYTSLRNDTNPEVMNRDSDYSMSASNLDEIIFQLEHNTILSKIPNAKQRFWDTLVIDMLLNNNDRNEDNWGIIKFKNESEFKMSPIFDCGNSFYGKTSDERIVEIMADKARLMSSAINGITAYEDNDENRIRIMDILSRDNLDLKISIKKVYSLVKTNMKRIEEFIYSIPNSFNGVSLMSDLRKEYYLETFKIRFKEILEKQYFILEKEPLDKNTKKLLKLFGSLKDNDICEPEDLPLDQEDIEV